MITRLLISFFFFNVTSTTEIYTLSLHDALPISCNTAIPSRIASVGIDRHGFRSNSRDRKSTRLNSSHLGISYAVFCLKKKKKSEDRASIPMKRKVASCKVLDACEDVCNVRLRII